MLSSLARRLVTRSHRRRGAVLAAALLLAGLCLALTILRPLGMNTDTDALFDADLPFNIAEKDYDRQFPADMDLILAVVDAPTKMQAQAAAGRLAAALLPRTDLYRSVRDPEG